MKLLMDFFFSRHKIDGEYKWVSKSFESITGYKSSDILGKNAYQYFHPIDIREIAKSHSGISYEPQQVAYRIRKDDGNYLWVTTFSLKIDNEIIALTLRLNWFHILIFRLFNLFPNL